MVNERKLTERQEQIIYTVTSLGEKGFDCTKQYQELHHRVILAAQAEIKEQLEKSREHSKWPLLRAVGTFFTSWFSLEDAKRSYASSQEWAPKARRDEARLAEAARGDFSDEYFNYVFALGRTALKDGYKIKYLDLTRDAFAKEIEKAFFALPTVQMSRPDTPLDASMEPRHGELADTTDFREHGIRLSFVALEMIMEIREKWKSREAEIPEEIKNGVKRQVMAITSSVQSYKVETEVEEGARLGVAAGREEKKEAWAKQWRLDRAKALLEAVEKQVITADEMRMLVQGALRDERREEIFGHLGDLLAARTNGNEEAAEAAMKAFFEKAVVPGIIAMLATREVDSLPVIIGGRRGGPMPGGR